MKPTTNNLPLTTYTPVIGMEVHAELKTKSKMFCGCKNDPFHAPKPNIYTCPVCLGLPGALPVANKTAVLWTIKLGLALQCEINLFSKFDRKNYFYPDLPKGYQISQYDLPFCINGRIETEEGPVRIRRIHLEEDTGKLQHTTVNGKKVSLIDFNRSSVPLIEIVTEPDIHSAAHAKAYAKKLRQIIRFLEISDCDMEQGSMRLEANISLAKTGYTELPQYKVEVKNINSFTYLAKAIDFEIQRHTQILSEGKTPAQETRGWNENKNITFSQRTKEDAEDYRYFPDPDLPPIQFTQAQIDDVKKNLPQLPDELSTHWEQQFGVEHKYSQEFLQDKETAQKTQHLFSRASAQKIDVNKLANLIVNKKLKSHLSDEIDTILAEFKESTAVETVDADSLLTIVSDILAQNTKAVQDYKSGKQQLLGFFIGQTMKTLGKKVDPQIVRQSVLNALEHA